ncbi:zinc-dependent metalloprotease family protein [Pasteuria penetrans]|uniref:zinc-dependent metalloprotease family protein n=1 Tax=Pasteuria penetrans TaxID=86005 RepID=UPI000FABE246|nr:zinc-dependent metalloprotease family protein [Pasteuria penetrans]
MNCKRQHFIIALTANLLFFIAALPPIMAQENKGETVNNPNEPTFKDPKEDLSNNRDPKKVLPNTINSGESPSINGNMKENTLRNGEHEKGKSTESNPSKTVLEGREGSRDKRDLQNRNPTTSNSQSVHVVPYADPSYRNHAGWEEDINKYMNAAKEYYRRVGVELEIDTPQVLDQDIGNMDVDANNKVRSAPHSSPSPAHIKIGFTDRKKNTGPIAFSNFWVLKHPDLPLPSVTSLYADHPSEKNGDMDLESIWTVLHEMGHDFGLEHKREGKNLMEPLIFDRGENPDLNNNENLQLSEDQKQQVRSAVQIWLHKKINWSNGSPEEKKASNLKSNPGVHPDKIQ